MTPDEADRIIARALVNWSHELSDIELQVWYEHFEPYDPRDAREVLQQLERSNRFWPTWSEWYELLSTRQAANPRRALTGRRECDCDSGWVFIGRDVNTVRPCEFCRPEQHDRWRAGAYAPHGGTQPRSDESKPLDRDTFQRGIDEARGELIKKGITQ